MKHFVKRPVTLCLTALTVLLVTVYGIHIMTAQAANTGSIQLVASSSQYLTSGTVTGFPVGAAARTMEAWVNLSSSETVGGNVLVYGTRGNYQNWEWNVASPSRKQDVGIYGINASNMSNTAIPTGEWHHIAITFDGTTVRYYLDGVADGTATFSQSVNTGNTTGITVGANNDPGSTPFNGYVDDLRVWDVTRTEQQIAGNKNVELNAGSEGDLFAYWKFNDSYADETSNNSDLTPHNSPSFSSEHFNDSVQAVVKSTNESITSSTTLQEMTPFSSF